MTDLKSKLKQYCDLKGEITDAFGVHSWEDIEDNTDKYFTITTDVHFDDKKYESYEDANYSEEIRNGTVVRKDGLVLVWVHLCTGDTTFMIFDEANEIKES